MTKLKDEIVNSKPKVKYGRTPLHNAVRRNDLEGVHNLIESGVSVNVSDIDGNTPLHHAAYKGRTKIAQVLIYNKANIHSQNKEGLTPLALSVKENHTTVANVLINAGANVNEKLKKEPTLLHYAVKIDASRMTKLLVDAGANIEARNNYNWDPITLAVNLNHYKTLKVLIEAGANIETCDEYGNSLLQQSSIQGNLKVVKVLLKAKSNIDSTNKLGRTALYSAIHNKELDVIKALIEAGANINALNKYGNNPLHTSANAGKIETVEMLIKAGVDIDIKNAQGNTAFEIIMLANRLADKNLDLHVKYVEIAKVLISQGCHIQKQSKILNSVETLYNNWFGSEDTFEVSLVKALSEIDDIAIIAPLTGELKIPEGYEECFSNRLIKEIKKFDTKDVDKFMQYLETFKAFIPEILYNNILVTIKELSQTNETFATLEAVLRGELESTMDKSISHAPINLLKNNIGKFGKSISMTNNSTENDDDSSLTPEERTIKYYSSFEVGSYLSEKLKDAEKFAAELANNENAAEIVRTMSQSDLPMFTKTTLQNFIRDYYSSSDNELLGKPSNNDDDCSLM